MDGDEILQPALEQLIRLLIDVSKKADVEERRYVSSIDRRQINELRTLHP